MNVNLDFVVLKSNKGKSKTYVAVEPEFKGNVEGGLWGGVTGDGVTSHYLVSGTFSEWEGKFVPDVHPVRVVLVAKHIT